MDIGNIISQEKTIEPIIEEQMVNASDFSSDIADVLIAQDSPSTGRVQGIMPMIEPTPASRRKSKNIFNLTDEQMSSIIAGIVGTFVFQPMVQGKLPMVNGAIQKILMNVIVIAILYFFAMRFYKNKFN